MTFSGQDTPRMKNYSPLFFLAINIRYSKPVKISHYKRNWACLLSELSFHRCANLPHDIWNFELLLPLPKDPLSMLLTYSVLEESHLSISYILIPWLLFALRYASFFFTLLLNPKCLNLPLEQRMTLWERLTHSLEFMALFNLVFLVAVPLLCGETHSNYPYWGYR